MQKAFVTAVCFFAIMITGVLLLRQKQSSPIPNTFAVATNTSVTTEGQQIPKGWREYRNIAHNFSLSYPPELTVNEYQEGEGAATITFQNVEKGMGFQIFVVPYHEQKVSEERFKMDIPSGVRTDLENIVIDTVTGASFHSRDVFLGETREIWFIHAGWLYEVTTLREEESWLSPIIKTWLFL